MNKLKNPSIQSFDKNKKNKREKSKVLESDKDNLEHFMELYKSKNKLSIHQFKNIINEK